MADLRNYVPCLVIIDVQQGMFAFRRPLYQGEKVLERIAGLLDRARGAQVPIFHVQHDGGPGHMLARGSIG
jgi:nicotinamidase-related amidase